MKHIIAELERHREDILKRLSERKTDSATPEDLKDIREFAYSVAKMVREINQAIDVLDAGGNPTLMRYK